MKRRRKDPTRDPPDPIADYCEWADNRYNPGHWLGANTPPDTRNLWPTRDRRWLGLGGALVAAAAIIALLRGPSSELWKLIYWFPWLILALILLFSRDNPKVKGK